LLLPIGTLAESLSEVLMLLLVGSGLLLSCKQLLVSLFLLVVEGARKAIVTGLGFDLRLGLAEHLLAVSADELAQLLLLLELLRIAQALELLVKVLLLRLMLLLIGKLLGQLLVEKAMLLGRRGLAFNFKLLLARIDLLLLHMMRHINKVVYKQLNIG
jgi:hypothetical protein